MDITWHGHNCFRLTERGQSTVVTDPVGEGLGYVVPKLKTDLVTISQPRPGFNNLEAVRGQQHVLSGPGEYEIGGVFITGIGNFDPRAEEPQLNVIYVLDYNSLRVVHLGNLNHVPVQSVVESFGPIHVALVPVGGGGVLSSSEAAEVISLIEPSIVIPMQFQRDPAAQPDLAPVDRFLKEMGVSEITPEPSLRVTASGLPEQTQIVLLDVQS